MNVEVRYFASLVDRTGVDCERVEVGSDDGVEQLWMLLVSRHPALGELGFRPMVACDMEYASWDRKLGGVQEVAFLPPVSGG
jgi:molybdopterin converting factor small subunit